MILRCRILPKYLDEIIKGNKQIEYREIEGIEFDDGKRNMTFNVKSIDNLIDNDFLKGNFPDVNWGDNLKVRIFLGSLIHVDKNRSILDDEKIDKIGQDK